MVDREGSRRCLRYLIVTVEILLKILLGFGVTERVLQDLLRQWGGVLVLTLQDFNIDEVWSLVIRRIMIITMVTDIYSLSYHTSIPTTRETDWANF